jgi:hypothetical protein
LPENRITVPDEIHRYHPLLRGSQERADLGRRPWSAPRELDVSVERTSLPRARRLMDTLIRALEGRGFSVRIDARGTFVVVNGIDV